MSGLDLGDDFVGGPGNRARASDVNAKFDAIKAAMGNTPGRIIVCNASGVPVSQAVSGDATLSPAGVLTIGANKVTGDKVQLDSLIAASTSDTTLDLSWKGLNGCSAAAPASGYYLLAAVFDFTRSNGAVGSFTVRGRIEVGGSQVGGLAPWASEIRSGPGPGLEDTVATVTGTLLDVGAVVRLAATVDTVFGITKAVSVNCRLVGVRIT